MIDQRNVILAVVLSIIILFGFEIYFAKRYPPPPPEAEGRPAETATPGVPGSGPAVGAPEAPSGAPAIPTVPGTSITLEGDSLGRTRWLEISPRVRIESPRLHGSISLVGGRIDDLTLVDYHEEVDPASAEIVLLNPKGMALEYYAAHGWVGGGGVPVPDGDTRWETEGNLLAPDRPVTLRWDNGEGLRFLRTYALDEDYMLTLRQRVENAGTRTVTLNPYGLISRRTTPEVTGFFILHEGLLGVFEGTLEEVDYDDIQDQGKIETDTTGGWIGITDKYWLAALIPDQTKPVKSRFLHRMDGAVDVYQVDYLGDGRTLVPGGSVETRNRVFVGAKEAPLLDAYEKELGIDRFDLAIDFGWFYFLTKPIFYGLLWINNLVGNLGVAILLLTVAIKLAFFPLANKSYVAMSKLKKLQPEMVKLRERYGEDKAKLNQEMMALYKREKANPASGCLPIVIQIPVFFALYKVLFVTIEMRHAPFFGWVRDLSAPDPTTLFNLFGLIPWSPRTSS